MIVAYGTSVDYTGPTGSVGSWLLRTQACWAWLLEGSAGCNGVVGRPRRRIAMRSTCCCGPWQLISDPAAGPSAGHPSFRQNS